MSMRGIVGAVCIMASALVPASASAGLQLYDRNASLAGTVTAEFAALIHDPGPNIVASPTSTYTDANANSGIYARGYPDDYSWIASSPNTVARSVIDFTNASVSSELNYPGPNYYGDHYYSRIDIYSQALPTAYVLTGSENSSFSARFIMQVFDAQDMWLGHMVLTNFGGQNGFQLDVLNNAGQRLHAWEWISAAPEMDEIRGFADWIVAGRTGETYYKLAAEAGSNYYYGGNVHARLDFADSLAVPEPGSLALVCAGLAGLILRRKRRPS